MQQLEFMRQEADHVRSRTLLILSQVDGEKWNVVPEGANSCLTWQAGHIIISEYFNAVACPFGPDKSFFEDFPIKDYAKHFGMGSKADIIDVGWPDHHTLLEQLQKVHVRAMNIWEQLDESRLTDEVVLKHPSYTKVEDVLRWSYLHEMWHVGQIAMLRSRMNVSLQFDVNPSK